MSFSFCASFFEATDGSMRFASEDGFKAQKK
jgi:hypothetical protein